MIDINLGAHQVIVAGIEVNGRLSIDHPGDIVRVRATDLRGVTHRVRSAQQEHPGIPALVDIQVMIAADAGLARAAMTSAIAVQHDTLLYVGTPAGLAGLMIDIHALEIADGAVLIPLNGAPGAGLIEAEVLPLLSTGPRLAAHQPGTEWP